jgi:hypothetical protein
MFLFKSIPVDWLGFILRVRIAKRKWLRHYGFMQKLTKQSQTQSKHQPHNNPNAPDRREVIGEEFEVICGG